MLHECGVHWSVCVCMIPPLSRTTNNEQHDRDALWSGYDCDAPSRYLGHFNHLRCCACILSLLCPQAGLSDDWRQLGSRTYLLGILAFCHADLKKHSRLASNMMVHSPLISHMRDDITQQYELRTSYMLVAMHPSPVPPVNATANRCSYDTFLVYRSTRICVLVRSTRTFLGFSKTGPDVFGSVYE